MESVHNRRCSLLVCMAAMVCGGASTLATTVEQYGGSYANWPSTWTALAGMGSEPVDGVAGRLDFVGSATDWGGYWAQNNDYVFFRMRVNTASILDTSVYRDSLWVLINSSQSTPTRPDFAFVWDSKSNIVASHGLEMQKLGTLGLTWGTTSMDDVDGADGSKGTQDINGSGRTGEGYVQSVDHQGAALSTSFIDFAVSWNYLATNSTTGLGRDQIWSVTFASRADSTDHNTLNGDIAGGSTPASAPSSPTGGWSGAFLNPEPASAGVLAVCLACGILGRRPRTRQG